MKGLLSMAVRLEARERWGLVVWEETCRIGMGVEVTKL